MAAAGLLALNRATDVEAAGQAAPLITAPVQNLLVADRQRIALFVTGRVPIRRGGDGSRPVEGADGRFDWIGWASGAQLPHVIAPASGRLVNANERIAPADFPVFLGRDWFGDWRARRIRELLAASDRHTAADFAAMQVDTVSTFAREVLPRLAATRPADEPSRAALALLKGWDGTMARDRPQPLLLNAWMRLFRGALLARLGSPQGVAPPGMELVADALLSEAGAHRCGGDCGKLLTDSLQTAVAELSAGFGSDSAGWRWGRAHQAVFAHPVLRGVPLLRRFGVAEIAVPGDDTTVFRGGMAGDGFSAVHGASFRGVYDLADLDRSLFVVAPGQSGDPFSALARNFLRRWRDGGTIALGPQAATVAARITLVPAATGR
jgi:penicillin amidase